MGLYRNTKRDPSELLLVGECVALVASSLINFDAMAAEKWLLLFFLLDILRILYLLKTARNKLLYSHNNESAFAMMENCFFT